MLMKKALLIALIVGVMAAWAIPAMAIDWSATGYIGTSYLYNKNVPSGNGAWTFGPGSPMLGGSATADWNDENSYWMTRGRLQIKAQASPDLYGVFYFEIDSQTWGETATGKNHAGVWGADQVAVEVKNLYVDFRVPPQLPVWLRVGMQTFVVEPNLLEVVDGMGVSGRIMIDPVKMMIRPFWAMQVEGNVWRGGDDADMMGVDISLPIGPAKIGGFFLYEDTRDGTLAEYGDQSEVYWLGVYASGKISMVKFAFDFAYDGGNYDAIGDTSDWDFSGFGLRGVVDATFGAFNVGLGGMYLSGGSDDYLTDRNYGWFIQPRGSEVAATLDDSVIFGGWCTWFGPGIGHVPAPSFTNYYPATGTPYGGPGITGMWGLRGFASVQPLSWLKIMGQVAYWGDTTHHADTYGNAGSNQQIGVEYDIGTQVQVYKNLQFKAAFGYLDAGGALRQANGGKPNDPWAFANALIYTF
jgi:hypothetical protein